MTPISPYGAPVAAPGRDTPGAPSREKELEQRLEEELAQRLRHIRQQIVATSPGSSTDSGRLLDIRA
ncbi:MAG: hypothetical protein RMJ43_03655 [Chloroherpetonaceae bacterium]|nr:hypothetical protein [Chthonomonadaceae bacterium]MDW8206907.1 hypothetical protein [Chloroherpetonaceae bacterium]